ncbi:MAG: hypothetical protein ACR2P3_09420, partial [Geminicoccaceae bacterium]
GLNKIALAVIKPHLDLASCQFPPLNHMVGGHAKVSLCMMVPRPSCGPGRIGEIDYLGSRFLLGHVAWPATAKKPAYLILFSICPENYNQCLYWIFKKFEIGM